MCTTNYGTPSMYHRARYKPNKGIVNLSGFLEPHYSLEGLRLAPLWKNSLRARERGHLPWGVPLSLHEVEGWRPVGEKELKLALVGDGVCRKVNTECAGEKLSTPLDIH